MQARLDKRTLAAIEPQERPLEVNDTDLPGFLLRVQPSGVMNFYVRYRLPDGRRGRMRIGDARHITPAQARDVARGVLAGAVKGEDPAETKKTKASSLGEFIEEIYATEYLVRRKSGAATLERLKRSFGFLWNRKLSDPTMKHAVENWRAKRLKGGTRRSTVNRDVTALRGVFSYAAHRDLIDTHPLRNVKQFTVDSRPKVRYLEPDEEQRLVQALEARRERMRRERDSHNRWLTERGYEPRPSLRDVRFTDHLEPAITLSLHTGMRRGELFHLAWENVDIERGILTVVGSTTKNETTRHIPLNETARAALVAWQEQTHGKGLVFPSKDGKPLDNLNTGFRRVLREAQIEGFTWHSMRHTFASRLVMAGVDLNTVRELLGHGDIKMTLIYAHLAPGVKAAAVAKLDSNVLPFPGTAQGASGTANDDKMG